MSYDDDFHYELKSATPRVSCINYDGQVSGLSILALGWSLSSLGFKILYFYKCMQSLLSAAELLPSYEAPFLCQNDSQRVRDGIL